MKQKSLIIILLFLFFNLNAQNIPISMELQHQGTIVNSEIMLFLRFSGLHKFMDKNLSLSLSYDPEYLTLNQSKRVHTSLDKTLLTTDNSIEGEIILDLVGTFCDCDFSYYGVSFITIKKGITSVRLSSKNYKECSQDMNIYIVEKGDVNADSVVNIIDALMIARKYAGIKVKTFISPAADIDCDQNINITDALLIAKYDTKIIFGLQLCPKSPNAANNPVIVPNPNKNSRQMICAGDINGNGNRDIMDALLLHRYLAGWNTKEFNLKEADVNCDGIVNSKDACLICYWE